MQDNKKKTIVLAALALVIVCVGAFQFVSMGSAPAAPVASKKGDKKAAPVAPDAPAPAKNPLFAANLPARDPFAVAKLPEQPVAQPAAQPVPPKPQPELKAPQMPKAEIGGDFGPATGSTAPIKINPEAAPKPVFGFTVSGVMLGAKPMAVFNDASGAQRLVQIGGWLDGDSQVVAIEKECVTVKFHGKTLKLNLEGNPNE